MSHYPPPNAPYTPPPIDFSYYQPAGDVMGPFRRAGLLLIVIGGLAGLFGACNLAQSLAGSTEEMAAQIEAQQALLGPNAPPMPLSPEGLRTLATAMAVLTLGVALAFVSTGLYVRRGSGAAVTAGIVLSSGLLLLAGLFVLISILAAFVAPPALIFACVSAVPAMLMVWALVWLIPAARLGPQIRAAQQQYQQQYAYHQQHQQAYAQPGYYGPQPGYGQGYAPPAGGYGYGQPPAPTPYGAQPPAAQPPLSPPTAGDQFRDPNVPPPPA